MHSEAGFRSIVIALWFRLITLAIVALVFAEGLLLATGKVQGWTFYLTTSEVIFEVVVRLLFAGLTGIATGTVLTGAIAPFLWHFKSSRESIAEWATKVCVVLVVFWDSRFALQMMINTLWSYHGPKFSTALFAAHFLAFVVALSIPRTRKEVVTSLNGFLGEKMTRRTALATVIGTAALVASEYALTKSAPTVTAALGAQRRKSNFLLITFDALDAEDMSLYGRRLPTTPNIDAFARTGTVFTNFYSACTFTTPSIATVLTGLYPSESYVYQLQGHARRANVRNSLPQAMRTAGYATGAFFSNPYAYYLARGLENGFDVLPEPVFQPGGLQHLWDATTPLHPDPGFGSRVEEHYDLQNVWNTLGRTPSQFDRFKAVASFKHAREIMAKLPDGFFLWVHAMTPHSPYLPDAADRGRFLPDAEQRTHEENEDPPSWFPHYKPDLQSAVDQRRLRYDEFIATADRAFGTFMSDLEKSGKLVDTTVIVSADHGESFEGGVYQHRCPYLTRPVIHVPLIIRTPDQQQGGTVAFTADQTSLAPTILDLAGAAKPDSMRGQSLVGWLSRDGQGEGEGLAFCQHLEKNSVFKPLRRGTVGVIDGQYQYVFYLDAQKGELRPLTEAQIWNLDRSAENPAKVKALRAALHKRFPELVD